MKKILVSILAFLTCIPIYSQNDPDVRYRSCNECSNSGLDDIHSTQTFTYDTARIYPAIQVADDYGPRQSGANLYDWHGGIDYNRGPGKLDWTLQRQFKQLESRTTPCRSEEMTQTIIISWVNINAIS